MPVHVAHAGPGDVAGIGGDAAQHAPGRDSPHLVQLGGIQIQFHAQVLLISLWCTIGSGVGLRPRPMQDPQPFTAPAVRPETMRRSRSRISATSGITDMMVAADRMPKFVVNSVWLMVTMPTGRV